MSIGMRLNLLHRDFLSGVLLLVLCATIWMLSHEFPRPDNGYPGAALFPRVVGGALGIMGLWLIIKTFRTRKASSRNPIKEAMGGMLRLAVAIGIVSTYPLLMHHTHFIPAMAILILVFGFLLKNKAWHAVVTASLSAILMYALFTRLLGVPI